MNKQKRLPEDIESSVEKGKLVTPSTAKMYLAMEYPRKRDISTKHVDYLVSEMLAHRFSPHSVKTCIAHHAGKAYLMNSNHTMAAIAKSGVSYRLNIDHVYCESEDEMDDVYIRFDKQRIRGFSDSAKAKEIAKKGGVTDSSVKQIKAALAWAGSGYTQGRPQKNRVSDEIWMDLVLEWVEEFKMVKEAISPCDKNIRARIEARTVLSIALVTMRYQPAVAIEFWEQVAQDNGLDANDPRKALNKKLLAISVGVGVGVHNATMSSPPIQSRIAAHAWNKYYSGIPLKVIRESSVVSSSPVILKGTPLNGAVNVLPELEESIYGN